jgi:diacylglycerol kinase (ATP)
MHHHFQHFFAATRYSIQGLASAWRHETAFRQEVVVLVVLVAVSVALDINWLERALLIGSWLLVVLAELLNSAIESIIERYGNDHHPLAGRAKDQASAAVMIAIIIAVLVWIAILVG